MPGCQAGRAAVGTTASANIFVHRLLFFFFAFALPPADIKNRNSPRSNLKFRFDKLSHGSSSTVGASGSRQARCCMATSCPARLQARSAGGAAGSRVCGGCGAGGRAREGRSVREGKGESHFMTSCPFICNSTRILFFI